jgi:hypothetical protein
MMQKGRLNKSNVFISYYGIVLAFHFMMKLLNKILRFIQSLFVKKNCCK